MQTFFFVEELAPFLLASDNDACGEMDQSDGTVSHVDVLPSGPAGAVRLHFAFRKEVVVAVGQGYFVHNKIHITDKSL